MSFDQAQIAQLAERRGTDAQILVLVEPRDRVSGETVPLGFWSGDDHQSFTVEDGTHLFFGAGAIIEVPPIRAGIGLEVRRHRVILPPLLDEVKLFLQNLQAAQARVRVWSQVMDLDSGLPLGLPRRVIKGRLERAPETLGKIGDQSRTELVIASAARALTFAQPVFKSDAEMRRRAPGDRFREHGDVIGDIPIPWGQATVRPAMLLPPNPGEKDPSEIGG
jgi:hypothetical protein